MNHDVIGVLKAVISPVNKANKIGYPANITKVDIVTDRESAGSVYAVSFTVDEVTVSF